MKRALWSIAILAAAALAFLLAVPSALAFTLTPDTPTNGQVVVVRSSSPAVYVHFSISVDLSGCFINPQVQPYHVELSFMKFAPVSGHGRSWSEGSFRGLLKPDHVHAVESFDSGSTTLQLEGDARIVSAYVVNGEVLRWTLPSICADAADPNTTDHAAATGTLRIEKRKRSGSSISSPPAKPPGRGAVSRFRIRRITSPASVQQNGSRGTATIWWSGTATFPVTMHDAPASCPSGLTCYPDSKRVLKRADPLTWDAWWCSGNVTSNWTLDYWFWLTDAKGRTTQRVRQKVTCLVG